MGAYYDSELIQASSFAGMGRYLVLTLNNKVVVLDLEEQYACHFEKMVPGISGAIYDPDTTRLFYTAADKWIYELNINDPRNIKRIEVQSECKTVRLYCYITGCKDEVVLEVDKVLYAYHIINNNILFRLPQQNLFSSMSKFSDGRYALIANRTRNVSVYTEDDDEEIIEASVLGANGKMLRDYRHGYIESLQFEGWRTYPMQSKKYPSPLLEFGNYMSSPLAADQNGHVLYARGNNLFFMYGIFTKQVLNIFEITNMNPKDDKVVNIYLENQKLIFLKEDEVIIYEIPLLSDECIRAFNDAYGKISRFSTDKTSFTNTFYKMVYAQPSPEEKLSLHFSTEF